MHEVPHYIILIRNSCFMNLKLRDSEMASVLKVSTMYLVIDSYLYNQFNTECVQYIGKGSI